MPLDFIPIIRDLSTAVPHTIAKAIQWTFTPDHLFIAGVATLALALVIAVAIECLEYEDRS